MNKGKLEESTFNLYDRGKYQFIWETLTSYF